MPALVLIMLAALVVAPVTGAPLVAADAPAVVKKRTVRKHVVRVRAPKPTRGERAASIALRAVGVPYRWGGSSMSGFDCSGLVRWAYQHVGVAVPHNSYALYGVGRRVPRSRMRPGDVLFFSGLGHVGLYLGRGRMVHAPHSGTNVQVTRLSTTNYGRRLVGARRMVLS